MSKIENWWLSVIPPTRNNERWIRRRIYASREAWSVRDTLYCQPFSSGPAETSRGFNCAKVSLFNRIRWLSTIGATAWTSVAMVKRQEWRNESTTKSEIHEDVIASLNIARWSTTRSFRNVNSLTALLRLKVCLYDTIFKHCIRSTRIENCILLIRSREKVVVWK